MKSLKKENDKEIANIDLKLKITEIFSKLRPENQLGFIEKMKTFDEMSKITSVSRIGGGEENSPPSSPRSIASNESGSVLSFFDDDDVDVEKIKEANEFLEQQMEELEKDELYQNVSRLESETIYRDDEIVAELMDHFRDSGRSTVYSNEDKLKLWIDGIMGLIKTTSNIEKENIVSAKIVDEVYKPIVDSIKKGDGSGVTWLGTISKENKKLYITKEAEDEIFQVEAKVIEANTNNQDPLTKFNGYDQQQQRLNTLSKPYEIPDTCEDEKEKVKLTKDKHVYLISSMEDDRILLDKRMIDDGVTRLENVFDSKKKNISRTTKKSEERKQIAYGRKGITGVDEVEVVERENICPDGYVVNTPCFKKQAKYGNLYSKNRMIISEEMKLNSERLSKIIPFRKSNERYIVINQVVRPKDPLVLEKAIRQIHVDPYSIPVSNVQISDKIVLRFLYPNIDELNDENRETIFASKAKPDISRDNITSQLIPHSIDLLVQLIDKDVGHFDTSDNLYHYKDGSTSLEPTCKIHVLPMVSQSELNTPQWENAFITIDNPRIIHRYPCDCHTLKLGNKAFILLTKIQLDKFIHDKPIESIPGKNRNYIGTSLGKIINYLNTNKSETVLEIEVLEKTDTIIRFKIITNCIGAELKTSKLDFVMSMDDFRNVYLSKYESTCDVIDNCILSLENASKALRKKEVIYIGKFGDSRRDIVEDSRVNQTIQVWCKVLATYKNVKNRDLKYKDEDLYLVQILQSSLLVDLGEYLLVPKDKILYESNKYIFEKELLGNSSMLKWFNGVLFEDNIESLVPSAQEFMNRIAKYITHRHTINNSFINNLLSMALRYDIHQIPGNVKQRLNYWIEWNVICNVEKSTKELIKIRNNYLELLNVFNTTNYLSSERFRLVNNISEDLLIQYDNWQVINQVPNYSKYNNKEMVSILFNTFTENNESWNKLNSEDKKRLAKQQKIMLDVQRANIKKRWDIIQVPKCEERRKEIKILDAIYLILDPVLRNMLLRDFIENNCYLSTDITTSKEWYYSKIDSTRTKLVCPHTYNEVLGRSLDKFTLEVEGGATVCNNCGQMLNTLVFSYFQGYDDESLVREAVKVVNGKEMIGTMFETDIVILNEHVFDEMTQKLLFNLEVIFNELIRVMNPELFKFFNSEDGVQVKKECIEIVQLYLIDNKITEQYYDIWKRSRPTKNSLGDYQKFMLTRSYHTIIARIGIMIEKQVPIELRVPLGSVIEKLVLYLSSSSKKILSSQIEAEKKRITADYDKLKKYLAIGTLYQDELTTYIPESDKLAYESKFENYLVSDINDSLTLYDAIIWLKYQVRKTHVDEHLVVEPEEINCGKDGKDTYTSESSLEIVRALEAFIESKLENTRGVSSRVQVFAQKTYLFPEVGESESLEIEGKYISKNLFDNYSSDIVTKIMSNIDKYRYIDYLIAYKIDENTDNVETRIFENGIDEVTKLTRGQLIDTMLTSSEIKLKKDYDTMKSKEITIETTKKFDDECKHKHHDLSSYEIIISTISKYLNNIYEILDDSEKKAINVKKCIDILRNIEKEYTIDTSGQKQFALLNINESNQKKNLQIKKDIAIKEYEKLTKVFNYFRRDYNYVANNTNLIDRKSKLAYKLDLDLDKGEDVLSSFTTDYDYLIDLMFNKLKVDELKDLGNELHRLKVEEFKIIENTDCSKGQDEYNSLLARNIDNKYLLGFTILKVLLQFDYEWESIDTIDITSMNVTIDDDSDNVKYIKHIAFFINDFLVNMSKILGRETEVLNDINGYKQETFELVNLMERTRRMRYADNIGVELMREFNKVMKGSRKLEVKEISSDGALETAKVVRTDRYDAEANGDYGKITENNVEGEIEGYSEERMYVDDEL